MIRVTCGTLTEKKSNIYSADVTVRHIIEDCGFSTETGKWNIGNFVLRADDFDRTLSSMGYSEGDIVISNMGNKQNAF